MPLIWTTRSDKRRSLPSGGRMQTRSWLRNCFHQAGQTLFVCGTHVEASCMCSIKVNV